MPKRIQRKRTKGWRMPPGALYVGRPTKWGNPYRVGIDGSAEECVRAYRRLIDSWFGDTPSKCTIRCHLRGKDLACWCPLPEAGEPDLCHASVLLEIANS